MTDSIDQGAAHRFFSADFFSRTCDLLVQRDRSDADIEMMIGLAHASRVHWRHRDDWSPKNQTIGAWQLSRVYSIAGRPDEALRYGTESLDIARGTGAGAFYVGYGHEAVARAAATLGDSEAAGLHLAAARNLLNTIEEPEDRAALASDLDSIAPG
jgi:hypothetical protein